MKSICFIVPYFGRFPETFDYWLQCCKFNKNYNWIILTDDKTSYEYPPNVKVVYTTLEKTRKYIENKMGFHIPLERPYKLCDFKPVYGYIFEDYLKNYDFWGYCDLDMLFGELSVFFSDEILDKYDKISYLGHMSLLKNINEINSCFKDCDFKTILQNPKNCIFDEIRFSPNINELLKAKGFEILKITNTADIGEEQFSFHLYGMGENKRCIKISDKPTIFRYRFGKLFKLTVSGNTLSEDEILYVHFQKRKIEADSLRQEYLLVPNKIVKDELVTAEDVVRYSQKKIGYFIKHRYIRIKNAIKSRMIHYGGNLKDIV